MGFAVLLYSLPYVFIELKPRYHRLMLAYMVVGTTPSFHPLMPRAEQILAELGPQSPIVLKPQLP